MISGECRVEPLGLTGRQLALDGLRLRLDLRIVPDGEAGAAVAAAVWRVEDGRVATLRLGIPALYRRAAVLAGLGALAVALVVWFAGTRTSSEEPAPATATPVSSSPPSTTGGASAGPARDLGTMEGPRSVGSSASTAGESSHLQRVAPRVAPLPPEPAPPTAPLPPEPAPPMAPRASVEPAVAAARARGATAEGARQRAEPPRPRPSPPRAASDMLELFDDMK